MNLKNENNKFVALYSDSVYEKPSVTVDSVVFRLIDKQTNNYRKLPEKILQVFLTKRNFPPFKSQYAVIGTFIDLNHELTESMKLCVKNKIGLTNYYYEQLFTFGNKDRDPRSRVLSVTYMLLTNTDENLTNGEWFDVSIVKKDTSKSSQFFELNFSNANCTLKNVIEMSLDKENLQEEKGFQIVENQLAFDHSKMIFYALERLKNKLEYTDIVFNLLPKKFTLTELKMSYEKILNEKLLDANFRRKINKYVKQTDEFVVGRGHRSSRLFTCKQ